MKNIKLIIIILSFYSCNTGKTLLTDVFPSTELHEFRSSTYFVEIYSIDLSEFSEQKIFALPVICSKDCLGLEWKILNLDQEEDIRVSKIIKETAELINKGELDDIINSLERDSVIYYSACYTLMKENEAAMFKYYDEIFLLDMNNGKYYYFKMQKGRFFPN